MYSIIKLNKDHLDKHPGLFDLCKDCFIVLSGTVLPSSDYFKRALFLKDKRNTSYLVSHSASGKIASIVYFHHYNEETKCINMHILPINEEIMSDPDILLSFKKIFGLAFEKNMVRRIRTDVIGLEISTISILKNTGFEIEAHLEEQIYHNGAYHDSFIYSLENNNV